MTQIHIDVIARFDRRHKPEIRLARNSGGWLLLVPLPLGFGLNIGPGFSGFVSVRSWSWARYDHADHMGEDTPWRARVISAAPIPDTDTPLARHWERYTTERLRRRYVARFAKNRRKVTA